MEELSRIRASSSAFQGLFEEQPEKRSAIRNSAAAEILILITILKCRKASNNAPDRAKRGKCNKKLLN